MCWQCGRLVCREYAVGSRGRTVSRHEHAEDPGSPGGNHGAYQNCSVCHRGHIAGALAYSQPTVCTWEANWTYQHTLYVGCSPCARGRDHFVSNLCAWSWRSATLPCARPSCSLAPRLPSCSIRARSQRPSRRTRARAGSRGLRGPWTYPWSASRPCRDFSSCPSPCTCACPVLRPPDSAVRPTTASWWASNWWRPVEPSPRRGKAARDSGIRRAAGSYGSSLHDARSSTAGPWRPAGSGPSTDYTPQPSHASARSTWNSNGSQLLDVSYRSRELA